MGKEPWERGAETRRVERANFRTRASDGYEILASTYRGKNERVYVHQLVAIADGADPNDLFGGPVQIHHSNGIPWDNRPSNIDPKHIAEHAADHARDKWGDRPWRDEDAMRDGLSRMSRAKLADEWGCSKKTISNWRKRHGIDPGTPGRKKEKEERRQTD